MSEIKQPSAIQTDSVRMESTYINSQRAGCLTGCVQRVLAGGGTFLPSAGSVFVSHTHTHSQCFHLFPADTNQAEIRAGFLSMNRFPFCTFLQLQPVPRKTRSFPGMAVGGLHDHLRTFSRALPSAQLLHA